MTLTERMHQNEIDTENARKLLEKLNFNPARNARNDFPTPHAVLHFTGDTLTHVTDHTGRIVHDHRN